MVHAMVMKAPSPKPVTGQDNRKMVTSSLRPVAQTKTLPDEAGAFLLHAEDLGLGHPPRALGLTAGDAASELGPPVDIDFLGVVRAAITPPVAIIIPHL